MWDSKAYAYAVFDRNWCDNDSWKRFLKYNREAYSAEMTKKLYKDHAGNLESFLTAELESTL